MKKLLLLLLLFIALTPIINISPANAQTCTTTPPTNTGTVLLSTTTTSGTYRLWARMKSASTTSNNSFYVKIDNGCAILVGDNSGIGTSWTWVDYQNGTTSNKIDLNLTSGDHSIQIIGNEAGVGVDKLLLTKNLTCIPTGTSGDNCPAEIPTDTPAPDTSAPIISNIRVENITDNSAVIKWDLNEFASGQIEYGLTNSYGQASALQTCCTYNYHIQTLTGLTPGATYHYRITSSDQSNNTAKSQDLTFTTLGGTTPTPTPIPPTPSPTKSPTPTPTAIPTPTPTLAPSATTLKFNSVKLHGIGTGGDNANPSTVGNNSPTRTTRTLTIELIDNAGNSLPAIAGDITYKPGTGDFSGEINTNANIPSGWYLIKVKSSQYLKRQLTGIIYIISGSTNTLPDVILITGDINNDNTLTINDYNILIDCYSDLLDPKNCSDPAKKAMADISDDGNVNASDYNLFLRELSVVTGN